MKSPYLNKLDEALGNIASMEGEEGCFHSRTMTDKRGYAYTQKIYQKCK